MNRRVTIRIEPETVPIWRRAAELLGLVTPKGLQKGQGNISGLMNRIASGAVSPYELDAALRRARKEQKGEPVASGPVLEPTEPEPAPKPKRRRKPKANSEQ
jgi:hypothetical protein